MLHHILRLSWKSPDQAALAALQLALAANSHDHLILRIISYVASSIPHQVRCDNITIVVISIAHIDAKAIQRKALLQVLLLAHQSNSSKALLQVLFLY
jgi:hypothetical protein